MRHYDQELKDRVIQEVMDTGKLTAVASKHKVPVNTAHSWVRKHKNRDKLSAAGKARKLEKDLDDAKLEIAILKELLKKTNQVWLKD